MKVENTRLEAINKALQNLERSYDTYQIERNDYIKRHKALMERKARMIQKILEGDKNV